jgi:hypothetical protein
LIVSLSSPQQAAISIRALNVPLPYALAGFLFVAACIWQAMLGVNPDTTWLTMMAERWLDGERPYVAVHENNPPASIYLYMPAAVLARITGIRSEYLVQFLVFALFAGCLFAAYRIFRHSGYDRHFRVDWLLPVCIVLFLLMPAITFAQREHIVAMVTLPVVATGAVRAAGRQPAAWMVALCGVGIGIAAATKPPLASIAVFISAMAALHRRSWIPVFAPENFIGAAVLLAYAGAIVLGHPEFVRDVMPLLKDVYLPNAFFALLVILPAFYAMVLLFAHSLLHYRRDWVTAPTSLVYAAALAYFLSYIVQVKFFDYHAVPVTIFLCLAICMGALRVRPETVAADAGMPVFTGAAYVLPRDLRILSLVAVAVLSLISAYDFYARQYNSNLAKAIRSIAPSARVVGFNVTPGWQLGAVRDGGGRWVGSFGYTYVPGYADWYRKTIQVSPDWNRRLEHWEQWTADVSARDIVEKKPDVVLVRVEKSLDWLEWMKRYPKLQKAMESYKFLRTVDNGVKSPSEMLFIRRQAN